MTLADVVLACFLMPPLCFLLDEHFRKESIPNLSRYAAIILQGGSFTAEFGPITFCGKDATVPNFEHVHVEEHKAEEKIQA